MWIHVSNAAEDDRVVAVELEATPVRSVLRRDRSAHAQFAFDRCPPQVDGVIERTAVESSTKAAVRHLDVGLQHVGDRRLTHRLREEALLRRFVDHEVAGAEPVRRGRIEVGVGDEVDGVLEAFRLRAVEVDGRVVPPTGAAARGAHDTAA